MNKIVFLRSLVRFLPLVTILAALCGSPCAATPVYVGRFTQTITSSNVAGVNPGAVYQGFYAYESYDIDGVFYDNLFFPEPSTLGGLIFVPFARFAETSDGHLSYGYGPHWHDLKSTPLTGMLAVENGQVSSFSWDFDFAGFYMTASYSPAGPGEFWAMSFYDTNYTELLQVRGTLAFSDPSLRVPDSGVSALMMACGFLGLVLIGRRTGHARGRSVAAVR